MIKKLSAMVLMSILLFTVFVSCTGRTENDEISSAALQNESVYTQSDEKIASSEASSEEKNSSFVETSSMSSGKETSSGRKPVQMPTHKEETSSETESESVKVFNNPQNIGLMCFSLSMSSATAYGDDFESRKRYFKEIVDAGYFNQYILHAGQYLLTEAEIIAEAGGSFWIMCTKSGADVEYALDAYVSVLERYINELEEAGYKDLLNGFFWDEPRWSNRISNTQFLTLTKTLYQKFGLRNYAVFATGEFTNFEGNEGALGLGADEMQKISRAAMQYLTDIGFDSYSVDVREGAPNGNMYPDWQASLSPDIVDGKSYYTEYRKILQAHCGHKTNFWHYPSAWMGGLWGGVGGIKRPDEAFWSAHLDFMAEDILTLENPGGLCIYTFRRTDKDENVAFERRMDLKDESGNWAVWPEVEKYETYCAKLRKWCSIFSPKKANLVKLS